MKKFIFVLALFATTSSGCHGLPLWRQDIMNRPPIKYDGTRNYHPEYVQGWQDGCHSGASAVHNHFMRIFYDFKKDYNMSKNSAQYETGWNDAYRYCTSFILQHNWNWHGKRVI